MFAPVPECDGICGEKYEVIVEKGDISEYTCLFDMTYLLCNGIVLLRCFFCFSFFTVNSECRVYKLVHIWHKYLSLIVGRESRQLTWETLLPQVNYTLIKCKHVESRE